MPVTTTTDAPLTDEPQADACTDDDDHDDEYFLLASIPSYDATKRTRIRVDLVYQDQKPTLRSGVYQRSPKFRRRTTT